jgi:TRAP transporter TAXI family solute receptor
MNAFSAALPAVNVRFVEQSLGIEYSMALQSGKADIALFYSDTAYLAFAGELDGRRYDQLRGVAVLDPVPLYIIVRGGSSIHTIDDLRGQRVSLGAQGSSTALTGGVVLEALDISVTKSHESYPEAASKLSQGELDAVFAIGNYPPNRFQEVLRRGARTLSLSEQTVARLHRRYPFVRGIVIPRIESGGTPALAIAVDRLLVCRRGLDEKVVYEITKAFFKALPDLSLIYAPLRQMNAEDAPATLIPLHEGAARYYREQAGL